MSERCLVSSPSAVGIQRVYWVHLCGTVLHFPELPRALRLVLVIGDGALCSHLSSTFKSREPYISFQTLFRNHFNHH